MQYGKFGPFRKAGERPGCLLHTIRRLKNKKISISCVFPMSFSARSIRFKLPTQAEIWYMLIRRLKKSADTPPQNLSAGIRVSSTAEGTAKNFGPAYGSIFLRAGSGLERLKIGAKTGVRFLWKWFFLPLSMRRARFSGIWERIAISPSRKFSNSS